MIESHMCADLGENCMVLNKCPKHGTLILILISVLWASPKVVDGMLLILFWYVDDLILIGDEKLIHSCK